MKRRVTDAATTFTPCRVDTSLFDPNAYVLHGSDLPNYGQRLATAKAVSASDHPAYDLGVNSDTPTTVTKRRPDSAPVQTAAPSGSANRQQISRDVILAREQLDRNRNRLENESGALGSGTYLSPRKSVTTEHGFVLKVMGTSHPARLTMRRKANEMLSNCLDESPQTFNELALMLKGLEPISMAARPASATLPNNRPGRATSNVIPKPPPNVKRMSTPKSEPSEGRGRSHVQFSDDPTDNVSVHRDTTPVADDRPALSLPVERRRASAPNTTPGPNSYHNQAHYAIGSTPNSFFISSLSKEAGGNIASLAHTIRPSDLMLPPKAHTTFVSSSREAKPKVDGALPTFSETYSAYGEPLTGSAPLLYDTVDQKVGQNYIFGPNQGSAVGPIQLELNAPKIQQPRRSTVAALGGSTNTRASAPFHIDNDPQPHRILVSRSPAAHKHPNKCGVSFTHDQLLAERQAQQARANSRLAGERGARSCCWSMATSDRFGTPVPGELKPCWVQELESQNKRKRMAEEKLAKLRAKQLANGAPIPLEAAHDEEASTAVTAASTLDRGALLLTNTVPDHPLKPHIPATRFVGAPRNFSFQSKSHLNFVARAPGPGTYSTGSRQFAASRHHRIQTITGCAQVKVV